MHPPRTRPHHASAPRSLSLPKATTPHHSPQPLAGHLSSSPTPQLLHGGQHLAATNSRSTALCDMVVAVCEQSWTHTYRNITYNVKHCHTKQFTLSAFFATRYVDNRLTLLPTCSIHLSHFSQCLSPHFYGTPIFLETEPGLDYLGFTINPSQHAIYYKATANLTDILSPQSASPDIVLRSRFRARAILARRLATPQEAVAQAMEQLSEVYKTAGYDQSWIQELCKESPCVCRGPNPHSLKFLSGACP